MGWRSQKHLPPEEAKAALRALVESGGCHAILAFDGEQAVGWCTFGPRAHFYHAEAHLKNASSAAPSGWSIPCFFIQEPYRGKGLAAGLLQAAIDVARAEGAVYAEAYPFDSTVQDERSKQAGDNQQDWSFTGRKEMFGRAGFQETGTCMNGCLHFMRCDWAASP
jgi:GNAT superfamily N-acetyltransferase